MRLKSTNKYYILGLVPLTTIIFILALTLARNNKWIFYPLIVISILTIYRLIKKFIFLPRPWKEYNDLKKINRKSPVDYNVEYFSSQELAKYSFIPRVVEVLSPLYLKKTERLKVVINEKLLKSESEEFINIAVCREIEKYKEKSALKITLALSMPLLSVLGVILWGFIIKIDLLDYYSAFIVNFLLPTLFVGVLLLYLLFWNKYVSYQEAKLDIILTSYFHINDVEEYINKIEELEGRVEKTKYKEFNDHYARQRISKLKRLQ